MHTVLMISSGIFHPSLPGRLALWRVLRATPGITLHHASSIEVLARVDPPRADALVLFIHGKTISTPALDALDRFVREGGGILAVHSSTASFKETPRYTEILGGRFTGHPPVGPLKIRPAGLADEIFGDIPAFTVTDEAYHHDLSADLRVHFVARLAHAAVELPIVWTRHHELGRICYAGWGHCRASLHHPSTVRILQAGLAWVCRRGEDGPR